MLESFKRFFASQGLGPDWREVSDWAKQRGLGFKRAREDEGFVVDGTIDGKPWRMEWGPSQRAYIDGRELRIRMELKLPSDMQMLLLAKPLMEQLERQTYEQFTEGTQTQIDTSTPEEMRWLVMFPKVDMSRFRALRGHFGAVAGHAASGMAWIDGPLGQQLERAMGSLLNGDPPFVVMTLRGRTYLRVRLIDPDVKSLAAALGIFEAAVTQALKVAAALGEGGQVTDWSSTGSTAWQSLGPEDPPNSR